MNRKNTKWFLLVALVVLLVAAYWYGGGAPGLQGWTVNDGGNATSETASSATSTKTDATTTTEFATQSAAVESTAQATTEHAKPRSGLTAEEKIAFAEKYKEANQSSFVERGDKEYSERMGMKIDPSIGKDKYQTDPVPEGKPLPVEPEDVEIRSHSFRCKISISCATILDNMDWLDPEKAELVPEDGWILAPVEVEVFEGESVFHVLLRTCKQNGIHMEFENTPIYNSAYIEGIGNLYEFDCGELSGWMYKVNSWFPNYGCSRYQLKEGDVIEWVYTCTLGVDVGGYLGE